MDWISRSKDELFSGLRHGPGYIWEGIIPAGESEVIYIPPGHNEITVIVWPESGATANAFVSGSSAERIAAGTAKWFQWVSRDVEGLSSTLGAVVTGQIANWSGPITAWKIISEGGSTEFEVLT